ncbi:MAG: tetratricopeptide repeat protein [Pedosphaera sp.]|nr:tetratricopeptide repeat protein [Pedosphaera sp.]
MSDLLIGALGALLATNQPAAVSNLPVKETGITISVTDTNDPVEKEFKKLMDEDDAAQAEVDRWIQDNQKFAAKGAGEPNEELNKRILARFAMVRKGYDDFLVRHTNHARAHLAYAGFLNDIHDEDAAVPHMEKALELDPKEPAAWNNLANYYGHYGEPKKAFEYYGKAIALKPDESVYYQNFGTTVYLFRKDAREFYNIEEQQVFDKALELYAQAMKIDPQDFPLASDVAQVYYGIKPLRTTDALVAWTNAFNRARDDIEREGVHIHFARINFLAGRTNDARAHLNAITNEMYADLKKRITRNLDRPAEAEVKGTNAPPSAPDKTAGK